MSHNLMNLPVPDTRKTLDSKPQMYCRVRPNTSMDATCDVPTDCVLQVKNIRGVMTEDVPVCYDHAGMAKSAARFLFGNGRIVQWQPNTVTQYQATVVDEGDLSND